VPFTILSHTADTGIEATADSFSELVAELASGMFALMADVAAPVEAERRDVTVESPTLEDLVVDTLAELLYCLEVDDVFFTDFDVNYEGGRLTLAARVVPLADVEIIGPPIKAVTYHDLVVEEGPDGWFGRVYFDV
jgi:SHS2 domain-containing protein